MAKIVFAISVRSVGAGNLMARFYGNGATAGKFARAMPTILVFDRPLRICTQWFSINLMEISPSPNSFTYSYNLRAGTVHAPSFFTFAAHEVRKLKSRSVAVMVSLPSAASKRKFDRIGIVVLRSTTPWVAVNSFSKSNLLTVISIAVPWIDGVEVSVPMLLVAITHPRLL